MGTRGAKLGMMGNTGDHPHAYGDKIAFKHIPHKIRGSSPRVWGQVNFGEVIDDIFRIIPTRMGTSCI